MRIAVTGLTGQIVSSLIERAPNNVEMLALGRPGFDLSSRDAVLASLRSVRCDAIVNAAAYTQVDKAESEPELAMRINGAGAGFVAETAAELRVPLLHLSTDYVFDGTLDRPYREDDPTGPTGAYGRSKLEGEAQIAARCANCVILRTAWVYSPFGANFVRTMLRLGETRDEVGVVADQIGNPTNALDIAEALLRHHAPARRRPRSAVARRIPYDRRGRGDMGGYGGSDFRGGRSARPQAGSRQTDHHRRLSDAGAPAGQFAPRQRQAQSPLRRGAAAMARVARCLRSSNY